MLRTIRKDDRHTYSEMMRTPLVRQLADSLTFEYFRRIRDLGNEASHFRLGTSGTMLETGERHYRVQMCIRDRSSAVRPGQDLNEARLSLGGSRSADQ